MQRMWIARANANTAERRLSTEAGTGETAEHCSQTALFRHEYATITALKAAVSASDPRIDPNWANPPHPREFLIRVNPLHPPNQRSISCCQRHDPVRIG